MGGFTGIILLPGSFSGRMSSPRPQRGPLYKRNTVKTFRKYYKKNERVILGIQTFLRNVCHLQSSSEKQQLC
jgi:hypothetical protein